MVDEDNERLRIRCHLLLPPREGFATYHPAWMPP